MQRVENFIALFSNPAFPLYVYGLGASIFFIGFVWFFYLFVKNPAIVDIYWPIGLIVLASLIFLERPYGGPGVWQTQLFLGVIFLWGLRLGIYLLMQLTVQKKFSRRYEYFGKKWGSGWMRHFYWFLYYLAVAFVQSVLALAFLGLATHNTYQGLWFYLGCALAVFSIGMTAAANWQLTSWQFANGQLVNGQLINGQLINGQSAASVRDKKKQTSAIMDSGLWGYSRHPNLFFEWLTWVGFALMSIESFASYWVLLSPAFLLFVFLKINLPLAEKLSGDLKGKVFQSYKNRVNRFFPLPPKQG